MTPAYATSPMRPISIRSLAIRAVALLAGFYALTIGLALALFVAPVAYIAVAVHLNKFHVNGIAMLVTFAACWVPAALLVRGLLRIRRPRFEAPGPSLRREEAPRFFALLDDLARDAGTAPPADVYLSPLPMVGVSEVGGTLGFGSRRTLLLGIPILHVLDVDGLRAVLAHELGHYLGGDTKLCGVLSYCETSFRAVRGSMTKKDDGAVGHFAIAAGQSVADSLGKLVVGGYANLYLRLMRPAAQRQELAADALAVRLGGRAAMVRALETFAFFGPMYEAYLLADVARAVTYGVVPSDLVAGFHLLKAHLRTNGTEASIVETVRAEKTDPFDNHPSLTDRIAAMNALDDAPRGADARPALDLFDDRAALDDLLVNTTGALLAEPGVSPRPVPWAQIPVDVVAADMLTAARELAPQIGGRYPHATTLAELFVAMVRDVSTNGIAPLVFHIAPDLRGEAPMDQVGYGNIIGPGAVIVILRGALVEQGATVQAPFLSDAFTLVWNGAVVAVEAVVFSATGGGQPAQLVFWASELEAASRQAASGNAGHPA